MRTASSPEDAPSEPPPGGWVSGLLVPDETLLRRFGYVRAVGGGTYILAVLALFAAVGTQVWPLLIGVPVLVVATTGYFLRSMEAPRSSVVVSLLADAVVFAGAIAYMGGTGSGVVSLYAIVIVSAGILLGPSAALVFTGISGALSVLQLGLEQAGVAPALLHRPELGDRLPILLVSLFVLASIGYLTATYASRLHELIAEAGEQAERLRGLSRRRRAYAEQASQDVQPPLRELDAVAEVLEARWGDLREDERRQLASRLRMVVATLDAEVAQLADVSTLDAADDSRPEPVSLRHVVDDCIVALDGRLAAYEVVRDVPALKVAGNGRAARRVVLALLENVVEHTPPGTRVAITGLVTAGYGVLAITDNGPGIPPDVAEQALAAPEGGGQGHARVGLPLVAELCAAMGAQVRHETPADGGTRFLLRFKLAPAGAPTSDDAEGGPQPPR